MPRDDSAVEVGALPPGWTQAPIGVLCTLINGRAFKPTDWTKTGRLIIRIQNLNNPNAAFNYYDDEVDARHLISKGELLFAWSGPPGTSFGAHV
jgi:type I restriction enzyme, S subunit